VKYWKGKTRKEDADTYSTFGGIVGGRGVKRKGGPIPVFKRKGQRYWGYKGEIDRKKTHVTFNGKKKRDEKGAGAQQMQMGKDPQNKFPPPPTPVFGGGGTSESPGKVIRRYPVERP